MAWFHCLIRGANFPGELIGESEPVGFYVNRFVEAADADEAEVIALRELRAEPKLTLPPGCVPSDAIRVYFEEITEVDEDDVPETRQGFVWFPMKEGKEGEEDSEPDAS